MFSQLTPIGIDDESKLLLRSGKLVLMFQTLLPAGRLVSHLIQYTCHSHFASEVGDIMLASSDIDGVHRG